MRVLHADDGCWCSSSRPYPKTAQRALKIALPGRSARPFHPSAVAPGSCARVENGACRMRGCRSSLLTRQTEGAAGHDGDKRAVLCSTPTCVAGGAGSPGPLLSALGRHARSRLCARPGGRHLRGHRAALERSGDRLVEATGFGRAEHGTLRGDTTEPNGWEMSDADWISRSAPQGASWIRARLPSRSTTCRRRHSATCHRSAGSRRPS